MDSPGFFLLSETHPKSCFRYPGAQPNSIPRQLLFSEMDNYTLLERQEIIQEKGFTEAKFAQKPQVFKYLTKVNCRNRTNSFEPTDHWFP